MTVILTEKPNPKRVKKQIFGKNSKFQINWRPLRPGELKLGTWDWGKMRKQLYTIQHRHYLRLN